MMSVPRVLNALACAAVAALSLGSARADAPRQPGDTVAREPVVAVTVTREHGVRVIRPWAPGFGVGAAVTREHGVRVIRPWTAGTINGAAVTRGHGVRVIRPLSASTVALSSLGRTPTSDAITSALVLQTMLAYAQPATGPAVWPTPLSHWPSSERLSGDRSMSDEGRRTTYFRGFGPGLGRQGWGHRPFSRATVVRGARHGFSRR